ncbi:MAG: S8 family peptidase [Gammaproteobacteria bacterium]
MRLKVLLACALLTLAIAGAGAASEGDSPGVNGPRDNGISPNSSYHLLIDKQAWPDSLELLIRDHDLMLVSAPFVFESLGEVGVAFQFQNWGHDVSVKLAALRQHHGVRGVTPISTFVVAGAKGRTAETQQEYQRADPYAQLQQSHLLTRVSESQRYASGHGVKIAIIDTGIDAEHVDLKQQIDQHLNFVSAEQDIKSMEFHATAVAGIIAAESGNGHGIVGVAPQSRLFVLRACVESEPGGSRGRCSSVALARALDWAIINQVNIINMSIRGQTDALVARLIRKAYDEGIVVVAATDLIHGELDFPAKLPEAIAVSDQESNSLVGLAAHSQRIFIAPGEEILSTLPNDTYDFVTGASFAAAHVSGIIALILEKAPNLSPMEITRLLRDSVRVVNWSIIVDSCQALLSLGVASSCDPSWQ